MANTMTLIQSVTVPSGGSASIDFTSIPSTYTDLILQLSLRSSISLIQDDIKILFNAVTTGYSGKQLFGSGAGAASYSSTVSGQYGGFTNGDTATASTFASVSLYIPNYAGSAYKSMSVDTATENNATNAYAGIQATLWSNTAAINQITLSPLTSGTWKQYSTAYLYGIKNS